MNIQIFRHDFNRRVQQEGCSINALAAKYELEQAALSRFAKGKQGLSASSAFKLFPFVYPDGNPLPPDEARV